VLVILFFSLVGFSPGLPNFAPLIMEDVVLVPDERRMLSSFRDYHARFYKYSYIETFMPVRLTQALLWSKSRRYTLFACR